MGIPFHEVRLWSAAEILLYQCYYRIAPWGDSRADIRTAKQTADVAMLTGVKKKGGDLFTIDDFLLKFEEDESDDEEVDASEMRDTPGLRTQFMNLMDKK